MMIKPREAMTREELLDENDRLRVNAEVSRLEIIELHKEVTSLSSQLAEAREIIQRREAVIKTLESDIEAIGAGGVSSQRITGTDARWYAVSADGMATLCINREDARDTAAEAAQLYPNNAPYTAVQMVPVGEGETFWSRS